MTREAQGPAGNAFVYPRSGFFGQLANRWVASQGFRRVRRALMSRLPFVPLHSDVRNVVYQTWWVDPARASPWVPPGVTLWQHAGRTPFTVLTYAHGHFGPAWAGPLRRVFPSPLQSNWRFYVDQLPGGRRVEQPTVLFVKNLFDHPLYAVGTRLFSDALPSHCAERFTHTAGTGPEGVFNTEITAGTGSAPAFRSRCRASASRTLPPEWLDAGFAGWRDAISFLCLQDAAVALAEDVGRLAHARIALPIDVDMVEPLVLDAVASDFLAQLGPQGTPLCFRVPTVPFKVLDERLL